MAQDFSEILYTITVNRVSVLLIIIIINDDSICGFVTRKLQRRSRDWKMAAVVAWSGSPPGPTAS